jgi:hypothetical protein
MNQDSSRSHSVFTITIETIEQGPASVSRNSCLYRWFSNAQHQRETSSSSGSSSGQNAAMPTESAMGESSKQMLQRHTPSWLQLQQW